MSFRNYSSFELTLDPTLTIIVGKNAIGKTNLVEAIQLMATTESFRRPTWRELIYWGEERTRVDLNIGRDGSETTISMKIDAQTGRREYLINGIKKKKMSEVRGILPCVVFTPDDLVLVKGPAESRRNAIDSLGDQMSPVYASLRQEYARVLRQRNALLREGGGEDLLHTITDQLIGLGVRFTRHRERLAGRLRNHIESIHHEISDGESLTFKYSRTWGSEQIDLEDTPYCVDEYTKALHMSALEEKARGTTLVGPHKDDLVTLCEGRSARKFASQGQQRTIALAWKLAEVEVVSDLSLNPPILLLDDVMSELDETRRSALARVAGRRVQTVVTTTNLGYFDEAMLSNALIRTLP